MMTFKKMGCVVRMSECISNAQEYLRKSIQTKAEEYKQELGVLYNKLINLNNDLDISELVELNDLSLFTDYLDYIDAIKKKRLSRKLIQKMDNKYNFSMIVTDDGESVFDTSIIDLDRKSATEQAWFREHDSGGELVFEDYEDDLGDDSDLLHEPQGAIKPTHAILSGLNDEDKQVSSILNEMSDDNYQMPNSLTELDAICDAINEGSYFESNDTTEQVEQSEEKPDYDFFNDFSDDDESDEDEFENEFETLDDGEELDNSDSDKDEEDKDDDLEDEDFKEHYTGSLKDKWGMFKTSLSYEELDSFGGTELLTLINKGLVQLPDDLTLLSDEMIDFLLEYHIINERPKKEEVEESEDDEEDDTDIDDMTELSDDEIDETDLETDDSESEESDINKPENNNRIFKSKDASHTIEAADAWRKKLGFSALQKFQSYMTENTSSEEIDDVPDEDSVL
jgi:hypothetical protein